VRATDDFFVQKREWSRLKDEILGTYLVPYLAKLARARRPIVVVDAFAGKGRFDDAEPGSPIIIAEAILHTREANPVTRIQGLFVEKKYYRELAGNVAAYADCRVLPGTYEEHVQALAKAVERDTSVLLFVDPYGVKSLDFGYFRALAERRLGSLELILNFNTFGFLREGCRLLGIEGFDCDLDSTDYEDDPDSRNSIERMNAVAGGDYWQGFLQEYHARGHDIRPAERAFTQEYLGRLSGLFKHVVSIPVQEKRSHLPKYRLFFGTQHPDGLILMADKMSRVWKEFVNRDRSGQGVLFEEIDFPDMAELEGYSLDDDILRLTATPVELKGLLVQLFERYGITYSLKYLKDRINELSTGEGAPLRIERYPPKTPTGRLSKSMDFDEYKIIVRRG
jgi:three-Cys-motif partner protein